MNQKELLVLSVGIFFTIIAWMIIDIYHLQNSKAINKEIKSVGQLKFSIDNKTIQLLQQKQP